MLFDPGQLLQDAVDPSELAKTEIELIFVHRHASLPWRRAAFARRSATDPHWGDAFDKYGTGQGRARSAVAEPRACFTANRDLDDAACGGHAPVGDAVDVRDRLYGVKNFRIPIGRAFD